MPTWPSVYGRSENPFPFLISRETLATQARLQKAIYNGIVALVTNYPSDPHLRSLLPLPQRALDLMEPSFRAKGTYLPGHYRPDLLHDHLRCHQWVCEINARFPLNGYLCTFFGHETLRHLRESVDQGVDFDLEAIPSLGTVKEEILSHFDLNKPLGILKEKEAGYCAVLLEEILRRSGIPCRVISPKNLRVSGEGRLRDEQGHLDQFLVELHQSEILALPAEIARVLFDPEKVKTLNDVRTIFLVHNKQALAVLGNNEAMAPYLSPSDLLVLRSHLLPTHVVRDLPPEISLDKDEWLLKPSLLGKGEGIIFGKNVDVPTWEAALKAKENQDHILQRYIHQKQFPILSRRQPHLKEDGPEISLSPHTVVGTLLCSNERFLGPGIYRSCPQHDIVAISRGGSMLFPALQPFSPSPSPSSFSSSTSSSTSSYSSTSSPSWDCSLRRASYYQQLLPKGFKPLPLSDEVCFVAQSNQDLSEVSLYQQCLEKHGICLIHVTGGDPDSSFMTSVVHRLGKQNPHSKSHTGIWDVKFDPKQNQKSCARSMTVKEFPFHTDCSFEDPPPRFFALYVVRADKLGGGFTELIDGWKLLKNFTKEEIYALQSTPYLFEVPLEFNKGYHELVGPILSFEKCFRFREDIITPPQNHPMGEHALNRLKEELKKKENHGKLFLPDHTLVLVDNGRFFHGRSVIKDPLRHLKRIRFHPRDHHLIPDFSSLLS